LTKQNSKQEVAQMVQKRREHNRKKQISKGFEGTTQRARKINASTVFETCTEQISPFGGLLGLIKFLDLIKFEEVFNYLYIAPGRKVGSVTLSLLISLATSLCSG
jgi:hypothetical protein